MHEYSLTRNIIETAAEYAGGAKVRKITLVAGEASGVSGESVRLYFGIIAENTPCAGAEIEIESVRPMLRCKSCGTLFERKPFSFECPCGGEGEPTEIGREFYIKSVEVG
ncbi:MAG: hydrogenase maturation nickel metallochaperone HypA [Firmicutes bacterium]|nr:hydrogenase maturation nickel metallochaperone HypA [Bacillota bacterium]